MPKRLSPKTYHRKPRFGFTLVEVMISVALAAVILVAAFNLLWQVLMTQTKSLAMREVQQNARLAIRRMEVEIRNASGVKTGVGESVFGAHPGKLTLDFPGDGTDVVFDSATTSIPLGSATTTIRTLRVKVGSGAPIDLTNTHVDVQNLVFTNFTRAGGLSVIRVDSTFVAVNPGGDSTREAIFSIAESISVRR